MRTVYLDELMALNLVVDYFLLLAAARLCALPLRRGRYVVAAAVGGLWSALAMVPALTFLQKPAMQPVLAGTMTLIAFGCERRLWRPTLAFLCVSALFGGAACAAGLYRGVWTRAGTFVRLDLRVLVLSFAVCWAAVSFVFDRRGRPSRGRLLSVTVTRNGKTARFTALEDTGNGLFDPITGRAALVAEASAVACLFPGDPALLAGDAADAAARLPGARLLPYAGVDGRRRLLLAFRPDSVTADGEKRDDLLLAVSPDLGGDGSYQAIL